MAMTAALGNSSNRVSVDGVLRLLDLSVSLNPANVQEADNGLRILCANDRVGLVSAILIDVLKSNPKPLGLANDDMVRLAASIYLKNMVRSLWDLPVNVESGGMSVECRELIKRECMDVLVQSSPKVRRQLMEMVGHIAISDVPLEWDTLLSMISTKYLKPFIETWGDGALSSSPNFVLLGQTSIAAEVASKAMSKYSTLTEKSNDVLRELQFILQSCQEVLVDAFVTAANAYHKSNQLTEPNNTSTEKLVSDFNVSMSPSPANIRELLGLITLHMASIIKAFHHIDLPDYFEDRLHDIMAVSVKLLKMPRAYTIFSDEEQEDTMTQLKCVICQMLKLYAEKFQEEYQPYNIEVTNSVLHALTQCTKNLSDDNLVSSAIGFMSATAITNWEKEYNLFVDESFLNKLCADVILTNVQRREVDLDQLEDSPLEFVRADLEADLMRGSRRDAALQLTKDLMRFYSQQVTKKLSEAIQMAMAKASASNSVTEKSIWTESAIFLVIAVSTKESTRSKGVTEVNPMIQTDEFFKSFIVPEIKSQTSLLIRETVLLKCATLKFIAHFRNQLSVQSLSECLDSIVEQYLTSENACVHTYAGYCIEKLFSVKLYADNSVGKENCVVTESIPIGTKLKLKLDPNTDIKINQLVVRCLEIIPLKLLKTTENEYLIRCLWKIIVAAKLPVEKLVKEFLKCIEILKSIIEVHVNPTFYHFLFETLMTLIKFISKPLAESKDSRDVVKFFEIHKYVLNVCLPLISTHEAHDFVPYCYQLLAGLLDSIPPNLSTNNLKESLDVLTLHRQLFSHLLAKERWLAAAANIPGITKLITSYLRKSEIFGPELMSENILSLLERFQFCLKHKRVATKETFDFLRNLITLANSNILGPYVEELMKVLLQHLSVQKSEYMAMQVSLAFGAIELKFTDHEYSIPYLLNKIQPGLDENFLNAVFIPSLTRVARSNEKLLLLIALAKFLNNPILVARSKSGTDQLSLNLLLAVPQLSGGYAQESIERGAGLVNMGSCLEGEMGLEDRDYILNQLANEDGGIIRPDEYSGSYVKLSSATSAWDPLKSLCANYDLRVLFRNASETNLVVENGLKQQPRLLAGVLL